MPVSHKHKILFIHIPKNAGKSFEIFLNIHNSYNGSPNSRSKINAGLKYLLRLTSSKDAERTLIGTIDNSYAAQHLTFQEIILGNFLSKEILNSYLKVAIVRDPYDRAFSLFNHVINNKISDQNVEETFYEFLISIDKYRHSKKHHIACLFRQQIDYLKDTEGDINQINILRLDFLQSDLKLFCLKNSLQINQQKDISSKIESDYSLKNTAMSYRNRTLIEFYFRDDLRFKNQ